MRGSQWAYAKRLACVLAGTASLRRLWETNIRTLQGAASLPDAVVRGSVCPEIEAHRADRRW